MIKIKTEFPQAIDSPDYIVPDGALNDNYSNHGFINELYGYFRGKKYSILDFGCAGGQLIVDHHLNGHIAAGIEGSNRDVMLEKATGRENWKKYENICLFYADATKDFELLDENDNIIKFDLVISSEFLEHPKCEDIPHVIQNMKKHLKEDGIMLHKINRSSGVKHQCAHDDDWWNYMFGEQGFIAYTYPFQQTPRGIVGYKSGSYHALFKFK